MVISIRNTDSVRCREAVRFSEGPLSEVRLYPPKVMSVCVPNWVAILQICQKYLDLPALIEKIRSMHSRDISCAGIYIMNVCILCCHGNDRF